MKKTAKVTKTVKVKKVRSADQKAARKLRRAQRRANIKSMAPVKDVMNGVPRVAQPVVNIFAPKETSDGLPFSKSIDNPYSILAQLRHLDELSAEDKVQKQAAAAKALRDYRTPVFAGWTGRGAPNVASFGE
jgi:hypothetical protein